MMQKSQRKFYAPIPVETERIGKIVLDAAYKVHTVLGPGLLESVYKVAMKHVIETGGILAEAQLLTYLRLTKVRLGFLINFNVPHLKDGIKRVVV